MPAAGGGSDASRRLCLCNKGAAQLTTTLRRVLGGSARKEARRDLRDVCSRETTHRVENEVTGRPEERLSANKGRSKAGARSVRVPALSRPYREVGLFGALHYGQVGPVEKT